MIGERSKAPLPAYGEGVKCTYPAGQAPRPAPTAEIKARVFREKDAAARAKSGPEKPE